jgi:hypothetical protein
MAQMSPAELAAQREWHTPPPVRFYEYHNDNVYPGWLEAGASLDRVFDPTADYFDEQSVAYQSISIPFEISPVGDLEEIKVSPFVRASNFIGPTNAPLMPASVLSHDLQVIDLCTPNTEWGGGYEDRNATYLTIGAQMKTEPLELPRYSYAAVDSSKLYAQAQDNVAALYEEMP